jgi:hypothetical protein
MVESKIEVKELGIFAELVTIDRDITEFQNERF